VHSSPVRLKYRCVVPGNGAWPTTRNGRENEKTNRSGIRPSVGEGRRNDLSGHFTAHIPADADSINDGARHCFNCAALWERSG
jgi:hypothetical protein